MDRAKIVELSAWLTEAGLAGEAETALLDGFCRRAIAAGVPLARAAVIIDTLHPVYEGRGFRWRREAAQPPAAPDSAGFWESIGWREEAGQPQTELVEYGPTNEGEAAENWRRSVFYHLLQQGGDELRRRVDANEPHDFSYLDKLYEQGQTDYVAFLQRFDRGALAGRMAYKRPALWHNPAPRIPCGDEQNFDCTFCFAPRERRVLDVSYV